MKCIVGLGNPTPLYTNTRHNLGFIVIDWVGKCFQFPPFCNKFFGAFSSKVINGVTVLLFKPMTYMNRSGEPLKVLQSFYKISCNSITVIHDDVDLKFGQIKCKKGGSSGGHNGLKSIDQYLGNDYWRIRLGIGRDEQQPLDAYVLSNFSIDQPLDGFLKFIEENFLLLLEDDKINFSSLVGKFNC